MAKRKNESKTETVFTGKPLEPKSKGVRYIKPEERSKSHYQINNINPDPTPPKNGWDILLSSFRMMSGGTHQPPYSRDPVGQSIVLALTVLSAVDPDPPTSHAAKARLLALTPPDSQARQIVEKWVRG